MAVFDVLCPTSTGSLREYKLPFVPPLTFIRGSFARVIKNVSDSTFRKYLEVNLFFSLKLLVDLFQRDISLSQPYR